MVVGLVNHVSLTMGWLTDKRWLFHEAYYVCDSCDVVIIMDLGCLLHSGSIFEEGNMHVPYMDRLSFYVVIVVSCILDIDGSRRKVVLSSFDIGVLDDNFPI